MTEGEKDNRECICCDCVEKNEQTETEVTKFSPDKCHCGVCNCGENEEAQKELNISNAPDNCKCVECKCIDFVENKPDSEDCKCTECKCDSTNAGSDGRTCTCGTCTCIDCENTPPPTKDVECLCDVCTCVVCEAREAQKDKELQTECPDEPPPFETPLRMECFCKVCTCIICDKNNNAGGSGGENDCDIPTFQLAERIQCMCDVCTCTVCEKGGNKGADSSQCKCKGKGRKAEKDENASGAATDAVTAAGTGAIIEDETGGAKPPCTCSKCVCERCIGIKAGEEIQNRPRGGGSCLLRKYENHVILNKGNFIFTPENGLPCSLNSAEQISTMSNKSNVRPVSMALEQDTLSFRSENAFYTSCCLCAVSRSSGVDVCKRKQKIDQLRSFLHVSGLNITTEKQTLENELVQKNLTECSEKDETYTKSECSDVTPILCAVNIKNVKRYHKKEKSKPCRCGKVHSMPDNKIVDLATFQIVDIKRITEHSILITWIRPESDLVIGYDILVNNRRKLSVSSSQRTCAIVHSIDHSKPARISIYARTKCGMCKPPAVAMYVV